MERLEIVSKYDDLIEFTCTQCTPKDIKIYKVITKILKKEFHNLFRNFGNDFFLTNFKITLFILK